MYDARSTSLEFLDRPDCDPALSVESYRFMEMINSYFGGIRVVKQFIKTETARRNGAPLRILDIGSGSCDIPLSVLTWARKNCIALDYTCLETSGRAIDAARVNINREGSPPLRLVQEDAFTHQPDEPYDCAVSSMCFHHFNDHQILTLVERLRGFVHDSVLINDLLRSERAHLAARLLLTLTSPGVRHDALLSIQRGFKVKELNTLLRTLDNVTVSVHRAPWFRVAAVVRFTSQVC